ncbi:MAG: thioredoxin family protein [Bacteroidia bacterium]
MKFKFYVLILFGFLLLTESCQTNSDNIASTELDTSNALTVEKEDYRLNRNILNKRGRFSEAYKIYQPDVNAIDKLRKENKNLSFVVFGGSWCSDTKKALPKFYKVVEESGISANKIALYGVDRDRNSLEKNAGKRQSKFYHIDHVPTFIVFYNGKEIGRLNEKTNKTIEEDIVEMVEESKTKN